MNKLRSLTVAAAVALALAACAQTETAPDDMSTSDTSASTSGSSTASTGHDPASYPETGSSSTASTGQEPGSTYPESSSTTPDQDAGTMSPSGAEQSASAGATGSAGAVVIGLQVESDAGEPLGTVTEIVADPSTGAPLFVVISTQGETAAMPYSAASAMVQGDALIVQQERLASAPRVEQSELHEPSAQWTGEANDYWGQGEVRTASPDPGAGDSSSAEEPTQEPQSEPQG